MKTLEKFLKENPSYCKCGNERISKLTGISLDTIKRFKKTNFFKNINSNYRNSL
jgi:hypothetical protein